MKSKIFRYFTKGEWLLWVSSMVVILICSALFNPHGYLILTASLPGVTALIFSAKGNPVGQGFMILFSILYGYISWTFRYYGEMITYLAMCMPMAIFAFISWMRHPFQGKHAEVSVNHIKRKDWIILIVSTAVVTTVLYFLLRYFHTANLFFSTVSVITSFAAAYLTWLRSPYFALAYAANDVILIILWILAPAEDPSYFSVVVCFSAFLCNDYYGFLCWRKMEKRQQQAQ